jgi:multiple sugar transport system substrate-binding protein
MDTWEHYRDVSEWFTRPDKNIYGSDNIRSKGWGYWWWEMHYASQALPCAYYFDDDMNAAINSPEGIAATKQYISFKSTSHPDVLNWDWAQEYASFTGGGGFSIICWPSLDKYASDPSTSKLKPEQLAYGLVPGTVVGGKLNRRTIYSYGNAVMGWAHGKVNKEAVYCLSQWFTSNEISAKSLTQLGFLDPYRWTDCNAATVQKAYGAPYLKVHAENYKICAPDIFMQGSGEYCQQLDDNVQQAWTGASTPEDTVKTVADAWNEITDRIGRDSLKEVWQGLKTYYPTVDTSGTTGKNFVVLAG